MVNASVFTGTTLAVAECVELDRSVTFVGTEARTGVSEASTVAARSTDLADSAEKSLPGRTLTLDAP